jgi:hypothetical protein
LRSKRDAGSSTSGSPALRVKRATTLWPELFVKWTNTRPVAAAFGGKAMPEQALFAAGRDDGTQVEEGCGPQPAIHEDADGARLIHDVDGAGHGRVEHDAVRAVEARGQEPGTKLSVSGRRHDRDERRHEERQDPDEHGHPLGEAAGQRSTALPTPMYRTGSDSASPARATDEIMRAAARDPMPTSPSSRPAPRPPAVPFADVCHLIDGLLDVRADILAFAADGRNLEHALLRLREGMRTHVWHVGARRIDLSVAVADYDGRTRGEEGLHALNDWDGVADRVNDDTIAVDVLNYIVRLRGQDRPDRGVVAILLDYYLMYLLALLSLRGWDEGRPEDHLRPRRGAARACAGARGQRPALL